MYIGYTIIKQWASTTTEDNKRDLCIYAMVWITVQVYFLDVQGRSAKTVKQLGKKHYKGHWRPL